MNRIDFLLSVIDSDASQRTLYVDLLALLLSNRNVGIKRIQVSERICVFSLLQPWNRTLTEQDQMILTKHGGASTQDHVVDRWLLNRRMRQLIINTVSPDGGIVQLSMFPEPVEGGRMRGGPIAKSKKVDLEALTVSATRHGSDKMAIV